MIQRRRFGREQFAETTMTASHRIKIGTKVKGAKGDYPSPTNGFYIVRNTMQQGGSFVVAYDLMEALGFSRKQVDRALADGRKAPDDCLPQSLEFVLLTDAVMTDKGWVYPEVLESSYQCWHPKGINDPEWVAAGQTDCQGQFCIGDGLRATRRMPDATRKIVACNPFGSSGDASEFCPYSKPFGDKKIVRCRAAVDLIVVLGKRNAAGQLVPLANEHFARYRLSTGSESNELRFRSELNNAANRLRGWINQLEGALTFSLQKKVTPQGSEGSTGLVPQLSLSLNQWQINEREKEILRHEGRTIGAAQERLMISAGVAPAAPVAAVATVSSAASPLPKGPLCDDRTGPAVEDAQVLVDGDPEHFQEEEPQVSNLPPDEEIVTIIDAHLHGLSAKEKIPIEDVMKRFLVVEIDGIVIDHTRGCTMPAWFLAAKEPGKDATRRRALRKLFVELDIKPEPPAVQDPPKETTEPAAQEKPTIQEEAPGI